jgi:hypothetical protein
MTSTTYSTTAVTALFHYLMDAENYATPLKVAGAYVETQKVNDGWEIISREFAVGDGATRLGYSDAYAYTVIARTAKTLTLQRDVANLLNGYNSGEPDALQFAPGGFCGHTYGAQRYAYQQDPNGEKLIARLTKRGWMVNGQRIVAGRAEHYDFNF